MFHHDLKKRWLILLAILTGVLLAISWPARGFPGLLFIALIPLLFVEDYISRHPEKFYRFSAFFYSYPAFFTWNLLTTWWVVNSTLVGAMLAIVINSFLMSLVFQAFHFSKKHLKSATSGYVALVVFWISFEYLHLTWNLNWPWLNLGNGFASFHHWVQWYEYTGTLGGTLWVLIANITGYLVLSRILSGKHRLSGQVVPISLFCLWILVPIGISYFIYNHYKEEPRPVKVVVVQPNFDPYSEQYTVPPPQVLGRIMSLGKPLIDSTTNFLVTPESAIQEDMWENDLSTFYTIGALRDYIREYPSLNIIVGGSTFRYYLPGEKLPYTVRKFRDSDQYYDAYNAAIMVNARDTLQLYHKSKLTPGVETLPSFKGFKWIEKFAIDLGGTVGSLGTDSVRRVYNTVNTVKASAVICYESVFGGFFAEFVRNGAELMFIITNDGWWGNTGGYRQHFSFASLRAIETRRSIARSANTGISAFVDQRGDDHQMTAYWKPAAIKATLNANSRITFYVAHGDYIARVSVALMVIILLTSIGMWMAGRKRQMKKKKMKINVIPFMLILLVIAGCRNQGEEKKQVSDAGQTRLKVMPFNADSAFRYVSDQVAFGPRVVNTKAHDQCARYLSTKLSSWTKSFTIQEGTVAAFNGTPLRFKNLIASFGPSTGTRVLLCAHWDSRPFADYDPDQANWGKPIDGANDGASGVGVLMEIARQMSLTPPPVGVDIILFDAEDYGPPQNENSGQDSQSFWGQGSQYWAKNPHIPGYTATFGILLDMVGARNATFCVETFSSQYAPGVISKVWNTGIQLGYNAYFIFENAGAINDDHIAINQIRKIPTIDLIHLDRSSSTGFYPYWHTLGDRLDKIDPVTLEVVGKTVMTVIYNP